MPYKKAKYYTNVKLRESFTRNDGVKNYVHFQFSHNYCRTSVGRCHFGETCKHAPYETLFFITRFYLTRYHLFKHRVDEELLGQR